MYVRSGTQNPGDELAGGLGGRHVVADRGGQPVEEQAVDREVQQRDLTAAAREPGLGVNATSTSKLRCSVEASAR